MRTRNIEDELFRALEYSSVNRVRWVLQRGADPNARNVKGVPALYHTIKCSTCTNYIRNLEKVRLLLDAGADVNAKCPHHETALTVSIQKDLPEMVDILLEYGVDVNSKEGTPPLLASADLKVPCIMQKLLDKGADVNIRGGTEETALHRAVLRGNKQCVETLLLQRDIEVNAEDRHGCTPFHCAAGNGLLHVLLVLLKHGAISTDSILANVGRRTVAGVLRKENGLEFSSGPWKGISIPFSKFGLDINHKNCRGRSALQLAAENGRSGMVEGLLSLGADINDRDVYGETPLMLCLQSPLCYFDTKTMLALLKHGADVNARNVYGRSALFSLLSSTLFWRRKMSHLLEYGADVNIVDIVGQTPLLYAEEVFRYSDSYVEDPFEPPVGFFYDEVFCVVQLCRHIIKLKTANEFSVNETNLQSVYLLSHPSLLELKTDCEKELAILRTVKVANSGLSLYDFLNKKPDELPLASKTKIIASFLRSRQHESYSYPLYGELLKCRFRMILERIRLIDDAKLAVFKIVPLLPSLCIDDICDYLNDEDLKNLIEAGGS